MEIGLETKIEPTLDDRKASRQASNLESLIQQRLQGLEVGLDFDDALSQVEEVEDAMEGVYDMASDVNYTMNSATKSATSLHDELEEISEIEPTKGVEQSVERMSQMAENIDKSPASRGSSADAGQSATDMFDGRGVTELVGDAFKDPVGELTEMMTEGPARGRRERMKESGRPGRRKRGPLTGLKDTLEQGLGSGASKVQNFSASQVAADTIEGEIGSGMAGSMSDVMSESVGTIVGESVAGDSTPVMTDGGQQMGQLQQNGHDPSAATEQMAEAMGEGPGRSPMQQRRAMGGGALQENAGMLQNLGPMLKKLGIVAAILGTAFFIFQGILSAVEKLSDASPLLGAVFDILGLAMKLFFMPFGNIMGRLLLPLVTTLLEMSAAFNRFMFDAFEDGIMSGVKTLIAALSQMVLNVEGKTLRNIAAIGAGLMFLRKYGARALITAISTRLKGLGGRILGYLGLRGIGSRILARIGLKGFAGRLLARMGLKGLVARLVGRLAGSLVPGLNVVLWGDLIFELIFGFSPIFDVLLPKLIDGFWWLVDVTYMIGGELKDVFGGFVSWLKGLSLSGLISGGKELAMGGMAWARGLFESIVGYLGGLSENIDSFWTWVMSSLGPLVGLLNPVGMLLALFAMKGIEYFSLISDGWEKIKGWIGDVAAWANDPSIPFKDEILGGAADFWEWLSEGSANLWQWLSEGSADLWDWLSDGAADLWSWLTQEGAELWDWLSEGSAELWEWLSEGSADLWSWLSENGHNFWSWLTAESVDLWDWLSSEGHDFWDWLTSGSAKLWDWLSDGGHSFWSWLTQNAADLWNWLSAGGHNFWSWLTRTGGNLWSWLKSGGHNFWNWLSRGSARLWSWLKSGGHSFWSWLTSGSADLWSWLKRGSSAVIDDFITGWINISDKVYGSVSADDIVSGFIDIGEYVIGSVTGGGGGDDGWWGLSAQGRVAKRPGITALAEDEPEVVVPFSKLDTFVRRMAAGKSPEMALPSPESGGLPQLAEGGIVTRDTLARIGEGGDAEAVIPLDKLDSMLSSSTQSPSISGRNLSSGTITVEAGSEGEQLTRQDIEDALRSALEGKLDEIDSSIDDLLRQIKKEGVTGPIQITAGGRVLAEVNERGKDKYKRSREVNK